jgi:tetratricopeptide (TPR) repeat protein
MMFSWIPHNRVILAKRLIELCIHLLELSGTPRVLGEPKPSKKRLSAHGIRYGLDTHPLIRDYFAARLAATSPRAWKKAHKRLFKHLNSIVPYWPNGLDGLQPLYQAISHACQAKRYLDAFEVYFTRILRGPKLYAERQLGATDANLDAIACLFERPWSRPVRILKGAFAASLLDNAAHCLQNRGRSNEAYEAMRTTNELISKRRFLKPPSLQAGCLLSLAGLSLELGELTSAISEAEESVELADRGPDWFKRLCCRTAHAYALHQAGRVAEAREHFAQADDINRSRPRGDQPQFYSLQGFQFSEFLLTDAERMAWQCILGLRTKNPRFKSARASCLPVEQAANHTVQFAAQRRLSLLDIALAQLTLSRVTLYREILASPTFHISSIARERVTSAVEKLHQAGVLPFTVCGFLTRAYLWAATRQPVLAQADLDDAEHIAKRGPMRLHLTDIYLYRARLFFREKAYPWQSPQDDLTNAEKLIHDCGYHRRDEELADAKEAILR